MSSKNDDISTVYNRLLELAILDLRMRIRYDDGITIDEVHDPMDALHNIPQMIRSSESLASFVAATAMFPVGRSSEICSIKEETPSSP